MEKIRRILIVDDCDSDREFYRRLILRNNLYRWEIVEHDSGDEGLASFMQTHFDCVLLDYSMPGFNGIEVLDKLKQINRFVAVIMLTGQGNESIAASSIKQGAYDYIIKSSVSAESINHAIDSAINGAALEKKVYEQKQELEQFARILAHDLIQPANSINGMLSLIDRDYGNQFAPKLKDRLQMVQDSSRQMYELIQALSSYTRLDLEQPKKEFISLNEAATYACNNLIQDIEQKNATINVEQLPHVDMIFVFAIQLLQILINNALIYNENDPVITISSKQVDDDWQISVIDNGIGIDAKYADIIFEPAKRLHGYATYPGTGLGLATAKRIVAKHSGRLWFESKIGHGSTFIFTIPKALQPSPPDSDSGWHHDKSSTI